MEYDRPERFPHACNQTYHRLVPKHAQVIVRIALFCGDIHAVKFILFFTRNYFDGKRFACKTDAISDI